MTERRRQLLPLYDVTAPIVCTLDSDEVQERVDLFERLQARLVRVERTEHGLLLHFPVDPDLRAELTCFAEAEKSCSAFWGFDVEDDHRETTLRWDAPPAADALVDRLLAFFRGDGDVDIRGLL